MQYTPDMSEKEQESKREFALYAEKFEEDSEILAELNNSQSEEIDEA